MISLYNNKPNKRIKFRISIQGVEADKVHPRLIIEAPDKSGGIMINGTIEDSVCFFTIPTLVGFEKGETGIIYYEAIVEEDQYAKLWADQYKVDSKTEIKVVDTDYEEEEVVEKPKITIAQNFQPEFEEIEESPIEESKMEEINKEDKKAEGVNENVEMEKSEKIEENLESTEINTSKEKENEESNIVDFYSFIKENNK